MSNFDVLGPLTLKPRGKGILSRIERRVCLGQTQVADLAFLCLVHVVLHLRDGRLRCFRGIATPATLACCGVSNVDHPGRGRVAGVDARQCKAGKQA